MFLRIKIVWSLSECYLEEACRDKTIFMNSDYFWENDRNEKMLVYFVMIRSKCV